MSVRTTQKTWKSKGSKNLKENKFYNYLVGPVWQIVRELKDELQTAKQDNKRILELNEYLFDKMNKQERDKWSVIETVSETTSFKHKGKRSKYPDNETSLEIKPRSRRERQRYISDGSDSD